MNTDVLTRDEAIVRKLVDESIHAFTPSIAEYAGKFGVSRSFTLRINYSIDWHPEKPV